jgi:heterodisulfide reductase subunit B2
VSYLYYPGCSAHGTAWDFGVSTLAVSRALGLEMPEVKDWICCGSTPAHQTDQLLSLALPAKNLAAAKGHTVAVCCAACYSRLKTANHEITHDPTAREQVAEVLGTDYDGRTEVRHFLEILVRELGVQKIADAVKHPLKGLRVACYYGCLLARPQEVNHFDDPENPTLMDRVLEAAGASVVDFPHKTECCGAGYGITDVAVVTRLSERILAMAKATGADCIATACPLCQMNLDLRQSQIEQQHNERLGLPVFFFTQLLGIALGLSPAALGLKGLVVNPTQLLSQIGIGG